MEVMSFGSNPALTRLLKPTLSASFSLLRVKLIDICCIAAGAIKIASGFLDAAATTILPSTIKAFAKGEDLF